MRSPSVPLKHHDLLHLPYLEDERNSDSSPAGKAKTVSGLISQGISLIQEEQSLLLQQEQDSKGSSKINREEGDDNALSSPSHRAGGQEPGNDVTSSCFRPPSSRRRVLSIPDDMLPCAPTFPKLHLTAAATSRTATNNEPRLPSSRQPSSLLSSTSNKRRRLGTPTAASGVLYSASVPILSSSSTAGNHIQKNLQEQDHAKFGYGDAKPDVGAAISPPSPTSADNAYGYGDAKPDVERRLQREQILTIQSESQFPHTRQQQQQQHLRQRRPHLRRRNSVTRFSLQKGSTGQALVAALAATASRSAAAPPP